MNRLTILLISLFILVIGSYTFTSSDTPTKKVVFVTLSKTHTEIFEGLKHKMKEYGWKEGKNITFIALPPAYSLQNIPATVQKAISLHPDIIVCASTPASKVVAKAIKDTNIKAVFAPVNNPLKAKILSNPKAPEGNITGMRPPISDAKRIEWFTKLLPNIKTVLVPFTPNDKSSKNSRSIIFQTAQKFGITIIEKPLLPNENIQKFLSSVPDNIQGIIQPKDSKMADHSQEFIKFALEKKIPFCTPSYHQVKRGALFAYGYIHYDLGQEAAGYVHKILNGVLVKDLPVKIGEAHLVINEATAKALQIEFAPNILNQAKIIKEQ
jgi:putative ABC transport system substrate-binding protein